VIATVFEVEPVMTSALETNHRKILHLVKGIEKFSVKVVLRQEHFEKYFHEDVGHYLLPLNEQKTDTSHQ
jgi:hypothetical protein